MTRYISKLKDDTHILPLGLQRWIVVYYVEGKDDSIVAYGGCDAEESFAAWHSAMDRPEAVKVEHIYEGTTLHVWHRGDDKD